MFGYIYKTTNLVNGKIYIGQKKSETFIESYKGSGKLLLKALKKYGKDNFKSDIICWVESKKELDTIERDLIKKLNSRDPDVGYNLAEGGEGSNGGGFKGKHHTPETIEKQRQASVRGNAKRKGKKMTELFGSSWVNGMRGKPAKNKGKKRISKNNVYKYVKTEDIDFYLSNGWATSKSGRPRKYPNLSKEEISRIVSEKLRGHGTSEETKIKIREANKGISPVNKGTKMMCNSKHCVWVRQEDISQYIEYGYKLGRKF